MKLLEVLRSRKTLFGIWILGLLVLNTPSGLTADEPLSALVDLAVGQMAVYEGRATFSQPAGTAAGAEMELATSLAYLVLPGTKVGEKRILLVRAVSPRANSLAVPAFSDASFYRVSKGLEVSPEEPGDQPPHLRVLDLQLPATFLPAFGLPAGAAAAEKTETSREEEVEVVGKAKARVPVRVLVTKAGPIITVTRALDAGKTPSIELDGSPALVEHWSETYVFDPSRRIFTEHRRELRVTGERGGLPFQLSVAGELKAKEVRVLAGAEKERAVTLEKAVGVILGEFRLKKHPRDLYARIAELEKDPASGLVPGVKDALLSRLSFFRQTRLAEAEATEAQPGYAGSPAPDFILEDLQGNRVAFREAIKGKVALLSFWGFACGPCRKEAPYLTRLHEKYAREGFTVIAVNGYDEPRDLVQSFLTREALKHPVLLMGGSIARDVYHVSGFPTNLFIDHNGKVVHRESGFTPDAFKAMEVRVDRLLKAAKASAQIPRAKSD